MIYIKNEQEVNVIREGGKILARILADVIAEIKPGTSTEYLENMATKAMEDCGGRPAFKNYPMGGGIFFPSTLCISINEEVVHGGAIPDRTLVSGDVVDIDIGMEWPIDPEVRKQHNFPINKHSKLGGFFTDMCQTVPVGAISKANKKLIQITKECLYKGIEQVKEGAKINDIARVIETLAENHNYGVVRDLVGHGVGYFAHEEPDVVHFTIPENSHENITLKAGMVICIEPMINEGTWEVDVADNEYTIVSSDGSCSAHFEHTILVTKTGYEILTLK